MFSLFRKPKPLKGYKITTVDRKQKYGIAANSLKMLKDKAANKLKIKKCRVYLAKDGTEIEDETYFETLESQTLFVIASAETLVKTDFQLMYESIRNVHGNVFKTADTIRQFVENNRSEFDKFICEYQNTVKLTAEQIKASTRDEHPEWFEGVPATLTTKEDVMARRSQDRIRGYLYKAKEDIQKSQIYRTNPSGRQLLDEMLEMFQYFLIGVDYFSVLFNRKWMNRHKIIGVNIIPEDNTDGMNGPSRKRAKVAAIRNIFKDSDLKTNYYISLCDEMGNFPCHGVWNVEKCQYDTHTINPYASRENVILFQMWNLDHQIEISRTVIPKILNDVQLIVVDGAKCSAHNRRAKMLTIFEYFLELFTMDNLRLVHICCHDKSSHDRQSNGTIVCNKCIEFKAIQRILNKIKKSQQ